MSGSHLDFPLLWGNPKWKGLCNHFDSFLLWRTHSYFGWRGVMLPFCLFLSLGNPQNCFITHAVLEKPQRGGAKIAA